MNFLPSWDLMFRRVPILTLCMSVFAVASLHSQVVINEVMPVPVAPEPEWVELYNAGDTIASLKSCTFHDATSKALLPTLTIAPRSYLLITKDTTALRLTRSVPTNIPIVKMSLPSLNNGTESLSIVSKDSMTLDSFYYDTKWGQSGRSLERRDALLPARNANNIQACTFREGASCGYLNSSTTLSHDVAITTLGVDSITKQFRLRVQNVGRERTSGTTVRLLIGHDLFHSVEIVDLDSASEKEYNWSLDVIRSFTKRNGSFLCTASLSCIDDKRAANDSLQFNIYLAPPQGSILINEFMFDPRDEQSEFVELYNNTRDSLDISQLSIRDDGTSSITIDSTLYIAPHDYVVIAMDSSIYQQFPELKEKRVVYVKKSSVTLNSSGDCILLSDPYGLMIDLLCYSSSWHSNAVTVTKGRSLEKLSPTLLSSSSSSWTSCVDSAGCTPGRINSVARSIPDNVTLEATPNPFSARSRQGDHQSTIISYSLPFQQARLFATIYDINGMRVLTLLNDVLSASQGNFVWDAKNTQGYAVSAGVYVMVIEAIDLLSNNVFNNKLVLVIGE